MSFASWDLDRMTARKGIEALLPAQRIEAHSLANTACTTCTGGDISCTACGGDGVITVDTVSYFHARVLWLTPGQLQMAPGMVMTPGETGDLHLTVDQKYRAVVDDAKLTDGYLVVDGEKVKPFAIAAKRVDKETSLYVRCNIVGVTRAYS